MYVGLAILALLLSLAICNVHYLDRQIELLLENVDKAGELADDGDFDGAEDYLRLAISQWQDMELYSHILIRHSESDSACDAFYEYLSCIVSHDEGGAGSLEKLRFHLMGIEEMEHPTLGSIF
jgi:hypothetical protein